MKLLLIDSWVNTNSNTVVMSVLMFILTHESQIVQPKNRVGQKKYFQACILRFVHESMISHMLASVTDLGSKSNKCHLNYLG